MTVPQPPERLQENPHPVSPPLNRAHVLGYPCDILSAETLSQHIKSFIHSGQPHQIITANPLMLIAAQKSTHLANALHGADLVLPESVSLHWALERQGHRLPPRLSGIDLMLQLLEQSAGLGWSVFFLGAAPGIAQKAAQRMKNRIPKLKLRGIENGYFDPDHENQVIARVARAKPDLLFVGMDVPRQDAWIHQHLTSLGAKVVMGVGGSFDVLAGQLPRAPLWMRRSGTEWLFRLLRQPSRLKRMSQLPIFLWKTLRHRHNGRF